MLAVFGSRIFNDVAMNVSSWLTKKFWNSCILIKYGHNYIVAVT
jgi:hypothetical protein